MSFASFVTQVQSKGLDAYSDFFFFSDRWFGSLRCFQCDFSNFGNKFIQVSENYQLSLVNFHGDILDNSLV